MELSPDTCINKNNKKRTLDKEKTPDVKYKMSCLMKWKRCLLEKKVFKKKVEEATGVSDSTDIFQSASDFGKQFEMPVNI